jgi:hypothetical protein
MLQIETRIGAQITASAALGEQGMAAPKQIIGLKQQAPNWDSRYQQPTGSTADYSRPLPI